MNYHLFSSCFVLASRGSEHFFFFNVQPKFVTESFDAQEGGKITWGEKSHVSEATSLGNVSSNRKSVHILNSKLKIN